MMSKKCSATIIKSGVNIKEMLRNFLQNIDFVEESIEEYDVSHKVADVVICSLALTHSRNIEEVNDKIKKYLKNHSTVIFCEPSSLSFEKLNDLGYKSIHTLFPENKMFGKINFELLCKLGLENLVTSVAEYGQEVSYHVKSPYLVPIENNSEIDYDDISKRENLVIDFPVYNMDLFVLSQFKSPSIDLSQDVELIQYKLLQPNANSGGLLLTNFQDCKEIGEIIYQTTDNDIEKLKSYIKMPMVLDDCDVKTDFMKNCIDNWYKLLSFSYEKISIVNLKDCIITGCGFLYSDDKPVARSDYLLPFLTASIYHPIWKGLQRSHPLRLTSGATIVAFNHLYTNYYHFLAECLQSAYFIYHELKKRGEKSINIVTCKIRGYSKEYFDILFSNLSDVSIIELDESEYILSENVYYCPELLGFTTPQPCLIAERKDFRHAIMSSDKTLPFKTPKNITYISRKDTKARRICNEIELIEALENLDVNIVELTGKSVIEQIKIFSNSSLVIGGHGAGISNSLFMQNNSIMLELIQASYQNVGPMRLAQSSGAQYVSMLFFQDGEGDSWYVDVQRVCRFVEKYKLTIGQS